MHCPNCQHQNESNAKYCSNCGVKLAKICSACNFENALASNFCSQCGNDLRKQTEAKTPISSKKQSERRQVTAMFCDLVGSTNLSEKLELEEYSALVAGYQDICKQIIHRFDGQVHQLLGDGVVTFFGFPKAHEDDARRCVQCALEIIKAIDEANVGRSREGKIPFAIRVGIHTGMVVGGEISGEKQVLGKTPNLAARLEGIAEVGSVAISPATYKLVKEYFEVESLGFHALKGLSKEIEAYKVIGPSGKTHRLDQVRDLELSPFVGRQKEIALIGKEWEKVQLGSGRIVLVKGDAGMGKSRLLNQLKVNLPAVDLLTAQTSSLTQNSAFYPLIEVLKNNFIAEELVGTVPNGKTSHLSVLHDLMDIPLPTGFVKPELSAGQQKEITLDIFMQAIVSRSAGRSLLFIFEDLHWSDPSTMEWLEMLANQISQHAVLAVITTRPMKVYPKWAMNPNSFVSPITLHSLSEPEILSICRFRSKGKALPMAVLSDIVAKTDGIPLFVEELTTDLLESGLFREEENNYILVDDSHYLNIPSTLQDSLMSRLDRLGRSKALAQIGSVLGREFSYDLLRAVSKFSEAELKAALRKLTDNQILFAKGTDGEQQLIFKHALVQDAAYDCILKDQRKKLHDHVAKTLEQESPELANTQPELIAHHLTNGQNPEAAIPKWMLAGQRAMQQNANYEAVHHVKKALELSESLAPSADKAEREIPILVTLGSLHGTMGTGAAGPERELCFQKAYELSRQSGHTANLLYVRLGLLTGTLLSGDIPKVYELSNSLFEIAKETRDPTHLYAAKFSHAFVNSYFGQHVAARQELEELIPLYDSQAHQLLSMVAYGDVQICNLTSYEMVLAIMGYQKQAVDVQQQYLERAVKINQSMPIWVAYVMSSFANMIRRDFARLKELVQEAYPKAVEKKEDFPIAMLKFFYGLTRTIDTGKRDFLEMAYEGLAWQVAMRNRWASSALQIFLAEFLIDRKELQKAAELLDAAEETFKYIGNAHNMAEEFLRVKGRYYQTLGDPKQAEHWYQKAITLSQEKQSKLFELRASNNLAELWMLKGKKKEAYQLIRNSYDWFTEGFDSVDLLAAKSLLAELENDIA